MHHVCNKYHYVQEINSSNMPLKKKHLCCTSNSKSAFFLWDKSHFSDDYKSFTTFSKKSSKDVYGLHSRGDRSRGYRSRGYRYRVYHFREYRYITTEYRFTCSTISGGTRFGRGGVLPS